MFSTVLLVAATCGYAQSSGLHPIAVPNAAPIVTAASSQYFERTFNRLIAAPFNPVIPVAPAFPVIPAPPIVQNVPVIPSPPVIVNAKRTTSIPISSTVQPQDSAVNPNVAIAIATAHAAAPVATILLPPYPFGLPPFGVFPQTQQPLPPSSETPNNNKESTTRTTTVQVQTTQSEQDVTTPVPSNIDNSFAQALPSNENVNFRQYLAPAPSRLPLPVVRPQKVTTNVEVIPVPLAYIAPPPLGANHHHHDHQHHHHQHHHHHHHQALKFVPHVHTFVPKSKIIIRPALSSYRIKAIGPVGLPKYGPLKLKKIVKRYPQNIYIKSRDIESTTYRSINRSLRKPPIVLKK